jgi:EAL domain-containing protein (putative c-di-GMP-specific phosphodiesterase class I)/GGDEF domain-containing protein
MTEYPWPPSVPTDPSIGTAPRPSRSSARTRPADLFGTDQVTGMLDRPAFLGRVSARRTGSGVFGLVRVGNLARLTKMFGQEFSNCLLREIAHRTVTATNPSLCGRIGSADIGLYWPSRVPESLHRLRGEFRHGIEIGDRVLSLELRVGLTHDHHELVVDELVEQAGMALSHSVGSQPHWYSQAATNAETRHAAVLEGLIRARRGDFRTVYQPIVNLRSGAIESFEALARWRCPGIGDVAPGEFFPAAAELGWVDQLTDVVIGQAFDAMERLRLPGVAVNVAPALFADTEFAIDLRALAARRRIPPEQVTVELLETSLIPEGEPTVEALELLAARGFPIAIDDFGTGCANLAYLIDLPIAEVKLAGRFVRDMDSNPRAFNLVAAIAGCTSEYSFRTVAEGAEELGQLHALMGTGCDRAQGYYIARPMMDTAIDAFVADWPYRWEQILASRGD